MPLYVLGFMGMSRRMEHYNVAEWQPYLVVAALGAVLVLCGIACIVVQVMVSIRDRASAVDETGDPWNGRTLEWATSSPPAAYNFAILPQVEDVDAFADMKRRNVVGVAPDHYEDDIAMPKSTGMGVILGATGFLFGFGMVWHIWWLVGLCLAVTVIALIIRSSNDDTEYVLPASEVAAIEAQRKYSTRKMPTDDNPDVDVAGARLQTEQT